MVVLYFLKDFRPFHSVLDPHWMYFELSHRHPCDATPVEQEKSRKLVQAKTMVRPWCLPRTVVKCETITSSFSFSCVAEMIWVFLWKGIVRQQYKESLDSIVHFLSQILLFLVKIFSLITILLRNLECEHLILRRFESLDWNAISVKRFLSYFTKMLVSCLICNHVWVLYFV